MNNKSNATVERVAHREITPIGEEECFLIINRKKNSFEVATHFHPEYELNFIVGAEGGKRHIGDHEGSTKSKELTLIGSNLEHGWSHDKNCISKEFHEITIQFSRDLFTQELRNKRILEPVFELLNYAERGILFSDEITQEVEDILLSLPYQNRFDKFILLQKILFRLAQSRGNQLLSSIPDPSSSNMRGDERINTIQQYIVNNYKNKIKLQEAADFHEMSLITFSRFMKASTGKSFIDFVNDYRLAMATRFLIDTDNSISDISTDCGFNNISNFNRIFKKNEGCTPSEFRSKYEGTRAIL